MAAGKIIRIIEDSLAEELELVVGDKILEVNGEPLKDIIDLSFAFADEEIELLVEHEDGEQELLVFDKDYDEELGAEFESAVFDGIRHCANHCHFCFVDQVPPALRSSLYVKDDDYRLSFLYGNFVTLTNMGQADFDRIKELHLTPLFVSVHTMNMELRKKLLACDRAGLLIGQLDKLEAAETEYHTQVVLCPDINDGKELDHTIEELIKRRPYVQSLAVVPVGLTKYRDGCYPLKMFDKKSAEETIEQVEKWQRRLREEIGEGFVYLGDEFYLLAGRDIPAAEEYDGFPQLDNGIGLVRNFIEEWNQSDSDDTGYDNPLKLAVVSGTAFAPCLAELLDDLKIKNLVVDVLPVVNNFFGEMVNVSGLLTGKDIAESIKATAGQYDGFIVPECALRLGENIFLDDMTLTDLQKDVSRPVMTALGGNRLRYLLAHWFEVEEDREEKLYMWQSNAAYTKPADWRESIDE